MNMHFVGHVSRNDFRRIDTKRLQSELAAIDSRASLTFGDAKGRPAMWVECGASHAECIKAIEAQAARLRIAL